MKSQQKTERKKFPPSDVNKVAAKLNLVLYNQEGITGDSTIILLMSIRLSSVTEQKGLEKNTYFSLGKTFHNFHYSG